MNNFPLACLIIALDRFMIRARWFYINISYQGILVEESGGEKRGKQFILRFLNATDLTIPKRILGAMFVYNKDDVEL